MHRPSNLNRNRITTPPRRWFRRCRQIPRPTLPVLPGHPPQSARGTPAQAFQPHHRRHGSQSRHREPGILPLLLVLHLCEFCLLATEFIEVITGCGAWSRQLLRPDRDHISGPWCREWSPRPCRYAKRRISGGLSITTTRTHLPIPIGHPGLGVVRPLRRLRAHVVALPSNFP